MAKFGWTARDSQVGVASLHGAFRPLFRLLVRDGAGLDFGCLEIWIQFGIGLQLKRYPDRIVDKQFYRSFRNAFDPMVFAGVDSIQPSGCRQWTSPKVPLFGYIPEVREKCRGKFQEMREETVISSVNCQWPFANVECDLTLVISWPPRRSNESNGFRDVTRVLCLPYTPGSAPGSPFASP